MGPVPIKDYKRTSKIIYGIYEFNFAGNFNILDSQLVTPFATKNFKCDIE